jgi:hypothetical protein
MNTSSFNYSNSETKQMGGKKIVRTVSIKNGKGYKSLTKYKGNKKVGSIKKHINKDHIQLIKGRKFIPGLFSDLIVREKTRKNRKK